MSNLINTGKIELNEARLGGTVPLTLAFSLGPGNLDGGKALLVVYDLEQYKEHQASLNDGEVDDTRFRGPKTTFESPPVHQVAPGTGVLFLAELTFARRPSNGKRVTTDSFVQKLSNPSVMSSPAFNLEIRCLSSIDANGNTLSPQVIDVRAIGVTGPDRADYDRFTKRGDAKRALTIRLLSVDRSRVLVSQLNPDHCFANTPVKIRYDAAHPPPRVSQAAPAPAPAPPPVRRKRLGDITGEYVELSSPNSSIPNGNGILAPAVLRVHHVGFAVCGWYSPLPSVVLTARTPSTTTSFGAPLFPNVAPQLSDQRGVFVLGRRIPGTTKFRAEFVFRDGVDDRDRIDPDALVADADLNATSQGALPPVTPEERVTVHVEFEPVDRPFDASPERIRISFPPSFLKSDIVFARISGRSRLPWDVVRNFAREGFVPPELRDTVVPRLVEDLVEPLPPAVLGTLISGIISPEMESLVIEVSKAKGNAQQKALRTAAVDKVNEALRALATGLRSIASNPTDNAPLSPTLIAQVREVARLHPLQFEGNATSMLSALQLISDDVVERKLAEDPDNLPGLTPLNLDQALRELATSPLFDGFAAFNILPQRNIIYRLEFTESQDFNKDFIILNGSVGAFLVTISKLDQQTGTDRDPIAFRPTKHGGFFAGGSIGVGLSLSLDVGQGANAGGVKKKDKAGATIGPLSVDILSFSDVPLNAFDGATFSIFASGASASASAGPGKAGAKNLDVIFSLTTNSVPPVTLETEVKKGFQREAKLLNGKEVLKKLVELDETLNAGKAVNVAQASASLTLVSLVSGFILRTDNAPAPSPRADEPTESILKDEAVEFNAVIRDAKFQVGSAALSEEMRRYLDLRLAVQRKLLEYPGWMDIEGLASPEWSNEERQAASQKNIELSRHRAEAVRDAIFESAGKPGEGILPADKDISVQGKGSQPFDADFSDNPLPGQHLSVFSPLPADEAQRQAVLADREAFLPTLRRVDIAMNGVFTLRLPAASAPVKRPPDG